MITQVGGVIFLTLVGLFAPLWRPLSKFHRGLAWLVVGPSFIAGYVWISLTVVPLLAAQFGREALPCWGSSEAGFGPAKSWFCLANRNYARAEVVDLLRDLGAAYRTEFPEGRVHYLDAGFPFFDFFPMLPHLSHRRGFDIDLALFYVAEDGGPVEKHISPVGYWAFAPSDPPKTSSCPPQFLTLRWDLDWLQALFDGYRIDTTRSAWMLTWLQDRAARSGVRKILIEPHLRDRFGLSAALFRFQGCRAARHDDHVHLSF